MVRVCTSGIYGEEKDRLRRVALELWGPGAFSGAFDETVTHLIASTVVSDKCVIVC